MKHISTTSSWLLAAATPIALVAPAIAQDDIGSMVNESINTMKAGDYKKALEQNTAIIERYKNNNPLQVFGAQFGEIYYRKGLCELNLKQWQPALASFETCYKDFPNKGDGIKGSNRFQFMALLKSGEAAQGAENWGLAVTQYQKFLQERDKTRDKFQQGAFYVNLGICQIRSGKMAEGIESLETAINGRHRFPTPDAGIFAGFRTLVAECVAKQDEATVLSFIDRNRNALTNTPDRVQPYAGLLLKAAAELAGAEMNKAAFRIYQLIPSTQEALSATRARLKSLGGQPAIRDGAHIYQAKDLQAQLEGLEKASRGEGGSDAVRLAATAYLHEREGDLNGAYAAYVLLEQLYPTAKAHETNLFNLVRASALIEPKKTLDYAKEFIRKYPDSKHAAVVNRLNLSAIFADGDYATCIEVAEKLLPTLKENDEVKDMCMHVLGGSYYLTGQYDKADKLLKEHLDTFQKSPYATASQYYYAANTARLQYWEKAGRMLDKFISEHPDASQNPYLPFALYDRANCHYSMQEYAGARQCLERVVTEFATSNSADQAYNLLGNVEQDEDQPDKAKANYLKALEIAETRSNSGVAGESLYLLVALLTSDENNKENLKEAAGYADRYWEKYSVDSPYQTRVAVAQVPALDSMGRGEEALSRLQKVISEMAKNPEASGLERVINSYTDIYLKNHTPEQLKDHYYDFPGITSSDHTARALLRVAVIGVFEKTAKESKEPDKKLAAESMIKVLFQQLKNDFALKDLTNFVLVSVGNYLRTETSNPREALPYYSEVLGRDDQNLRFDALMGRADIYGMSDSQDDLDKALADFQRVMDDSQDRKQKEFSLFRSIQLLMKKGDYAEAAKQANAYFAKKTYRQYTSQVGLLLAESFEKRKMVDDAITMYVKVWSADQGNIRISAPAILSWMRLTFERGKPAAGPDQPGDRQGAYNGGAQYVQQTARFQDQMPADVLESWKKVESLVQEYEARPDVKSLKELEEEKAK